MFIQYLFDRYIRYFIFYCNFDIHFDLNSKYFQKPFKKYKLINVMVLLFDDKFNKPINKIFLIDGKKVIINLPQTLKSLTLGDNFNQPLDKTILENGRPTLVGILPRNLKELTLGNNFNQPIDHLPQNLKKLTLDYYFFLDINNLPKSLKKINFICDADSDDEDQSEYSVDDLMDKYDRYKENIFILKHDYNRPNYNLPQKLKIVIN